MSSDLAQFYALIHAGLSPKEAYETIGEDSFRGVPAQEVKSVLKIGEIFTDYTCPAFQREYMERIKRIVQQSFLRDKNNKLIRHPRFSDNFFKYVCTFDKGDDWLEIVCLFEHVVLTENIQNFIADLIISRTRNDPSYYNECFAAYNTIRTAFTSPKAQVRLYKGINSITKPSVLPVAEMIPPFHSMSTGVDITSFNIPCRDIQLLELKRDFISTLGWTKYALEVNQELVCKELKEFFEYTKACADKIPT